MDILSLFEIESCHFSGKWGEWFLERMISKIKATPFPYGLDGTGKEHAENVLRLSMYMGQCMKLSNNQLMILGYSAYLHDIGKSLDNGKKSSKKYSFLKKEDLVKEHVACGYMLLKESDTYKEIAENVYFHHERWDGNGYPSGLKEKEIPLESRIISIANDYDNNYTKVDFSHFAHKEAMKEIIRNKGYCYDPSLVEIFYRNFHQRWYKEQNA